MELKKVERWILANQYEILAKLDPKNKKEYDTIREAIEGGYKFEYERFSEFISDDELSKEDSMWILDVLDMFSTMIRSYKELKDKSGINKTDIYFWGFDGNSETKKLSYVRYLIDELGRYDDLKHKDYNSHCPMSETYNNMLEKWDSFGREKYPLTKQELLELIKVFKGK